MRKSLQDNSLSAADCKRERGNRFLAGVMRAMAESDADAYAPLIADEFTATDTFHDRPYTKRTGLRKSKNRNNELGDAPRLRNYCRPRCLILAKR